MISPCDKSESIKKENIMLAPMAGITDSVFRLLAKRGGAGSVFTEMVSASALFQRNKKTISMLDFHEEERPVVAQVFGSDKNHIKAAAKVVSALGFDGLNINFGCPAKKIIKSNSGAAVLRDLKLYAELIKTAVFSSDVPVSVKIRPGFDKNDEKIEEISKVAEESGASQIIVHGRFATQRHSGAANFDLISKAVDSVGISVIANGGIDSEEAAEYVVKKTNCAGIMIGRAAIGDYNIFDRISHYLEFGEKKSPPSWEDKIESLLEHARLASERYGERWGIIKLRKISSYYLTGLPNAKKIRGMINQIERIDELKAALESVFVLGIVSF